MFKGHKVHIRQTGRICKVKIDDLEMKGVRCAEFRTSVDEIPVVVLEFYTHDVEVEAEVETEVEGGKQ